jgi:uncharacterized protein YoxC
MILTIAEIILLLSASALCIYLIMYIGRITRAVEDMKTEIQKISDNLKPLLNSLQTLSYSLLSISDDIKNQVGKVRWVVDEVKSRVDSILNFENKIKETIENPVQNIKDNIGAWRAGFTAFWNKFKNK